MTDQLARDLGASIRGDVQFDAVARAMYATDASIYQIAPRGVVLPRDEADVAAVLRIARRHGAALLPRGGGTSLAGQTVGDAIQLDFSKYMARVLDINLEAGYAWVEPGIVLDTLNAQLASTGLMFAPDVSPSNRATIGGMIGNNSSGMYSLVYGKTIDHVLELRVMLADGSITTLGPLSAEELEAKLALTNLEGRCYRAVRRLAREHAEEIAQRYPRVLRRVGGYNLDAFVPGVSITPAAYRDTSAFNLARMIIGSEGTLAIILAAKLRLVPRPAHTAIGILAFETLEQALDAVVPCLECQPAAVELMDDILLDLARRSPEYGTYLSQFVNGAPCGLLQVEFFGASQAAVAADLDRLEQHLHSAGITVHMTRATTPEVKRAVLQVRKASMPLLQSISPDLRPETFVEDSAVAPEKLSDYIRCFREICRAEGVPVAIYGHASVGLIHARPLLNLKDAGDVVKMRRIAEAIKDLSVEFGGALSGEHGDGLVRSEFNRELFGPALYEVFREIKRTFDQQGLLNPGKIVDAQPMDLNLRYGANYQTIPLQTHFRFADSGGMAGATELCNGNGLCRKVSSGTMCPSYMVTRDERHSTRGRANALRVALSGALAPGELTGEQMHATLDLCLECKGCTGECPSRVNMTRLKSEWLAHYYADHGVPLRARLFGNIHVLNRLGSALAPLANPALRAPGVAALQEKLLGVSRQRRLPAFAPASFERWFARRGKQPLRGPRSVVLFPDTFSNYNEPHIAQAAVQVLEALGYEVLLPRRRVCCGRPMLSKGLLPQAKRLAQQQLEWLAPYAAAGLPIIGLEPSCILSFRDEYPDLLDDPRTAVLARQSFLLDEFLARDIDALRARAATAAPRTYLLHGHCHQKALIGSGHALKLLRAIPGAKVSEVDSGCCGMAGSFGYEAEHYELSRQVGERVLLPAVRAAAPETTIVAMGTSCRHQIADLAGRRAYHLAEVLAEVVSVRRHDDKVAR